jgi:hypothetical protein
MYKCLLFLGDVVVVVVEGTGLMDETGVPVVELYTPLDRKVVIFILGC